MKLRQDEKYSNELRKQYGMKTEKEIEQERKEKIRRYKELENEPELSPKERKEKEHLINDVVVFYDSKKHRIHLSGGAVVALWIRYIYGNKKWKETKGNEPETEKILEFEKTYNVKLSCDDLDNNVVKIKKIRWEK